MGRRGHELSSGRKPGATTDVGALVARKNEKTSAEHRDARSRMAALRNAWDSFLGAENAAQHGVIQRAGAQTRSLALQALRAGVL